MSDRKVMTIDALQHQEPSRELFEEWRQGNLSVISSSLVLWEGARRALDEIKRWDRLFEEHDDLIYQIRSSADIQAAADSERTGVILSFQNSSPYEEDLDMVAIFKQLGINIVQLTYNNQNPVGGSCYEPNDSGLARYGYELIEEMARVGVLIDLSHVGDRTSLDVIAASKVPVAITHANPRTTKDVDLWQRNKPDEVIKALADAGGVIGLSFYPHLVVGGSDCTPDWFFGMVRDTVDKFGIDCVGLGSDFHSTLTVEFLEYSQQGTWKRDLPEGIEDMDYKPAYPSWARNSADYPKVAEMFSAHGFSDDEIEKIMGENWLRLFKATF